MRRNVSDISSLEKELNRIEYQLNRNRVFSKDRNIPYKKENIQNENQFGHMRPNDDHIRHMIKSEFIKLFQHEMVKISNNFKKDIYNNKSKIADIEYKLSFIQPLKEPINEYNKNIYNEKSNMIDTDNFLKKDEFELKMKQIKVDILGEINNSNNKMMNQELNFSLKNESEINKLKQKHNNIELQINTMKEDLNKILISNNSSLNKEYIDNKKLEQILFDFKNDINTKVAKIVSNFKKVRESINKFEKKIKENKEEINELKNTINEINNNYVKKNDFCIHNNSINSKPNTSTIVLFKEHLVDNQNNIINYEPKKNFDNLKKEEEKDKYKINIINEESNDDNINLKKEEFKIKSIRGEFNDDNRINSIDEKPDNNKINFKKEKFKITSIIDQSNNDNNNLKKEIFKNDFINEKSHNNNSNSKKEKFKVTSIIDELNDNNN